MPSKSDTTFSKILVESGLLTDRQASTCLEAIQKSEEDGHPKALGEVILERGLVPEKPLRNAFSLMTRFPFEPRPRGAVVGKYRVVRQIGHGGMGPCYEVAHVDVPQESAVLKILPSVMAGIAEFRERFFIQAIKAMRLRHENVVRTIEADADGETCYVVQELVPGQALGSILDHLPMLEEIQAREIVVQAALAIRHLDLFGLTHRNLKPNNILLANTGLVKLVDCCLAPFTGWGEPLIQITQHWGAPYYSSPEQGRPDQALGLQSDLYSLGVVFYEMLTGGVPFSGGIPVLDLRRRMTEEWPDPRSKNANISDQALQILWKMTALRPEDRYPDIEALLADLESFPGLERTDEPARPAPEPSGAGDADWADTRVVPTVEPPGESAEGEEPGSSEAGESTFNGFYEQAEAAEGSPPHDGEPGAFLDGSRELMALVSETEKIQSKGPTPVKNLTVQEPEDEEGEGELEHADAEGEKTEAPAADHDRPSPEAEPDKTRDRLSPAAIGLASAGLTVLLVVVILYLLGIFG